LTTLAYGVVQIRVTPKTRNPFTIGAPSISGVTWKWHVLNHAPSRDGTILVGMASVDEFETALAAVLKGPLPPAAPLIEPTGSCIKALKQPSDGTHGAGGPPRTSSACPNRLARPGVAASDTFV